jgi:hypothetical protein
VAVIPPQRSKQLNKATTVKSRTVRLASNARHVLEKHKPAHPPYRDGHAGLPRSVRLPATAPLSQQLSMASVRGTTTSTPSSALRLAASTPSTDSSHPSSSESRRVAHSSKARAMKKS